MTEDADVAAPLRLRARRPTIRELLLDHGFTEELLGDERPPVSEYRLGDEDGGFYAEFLIPMVGSRAKRDGTANATIEVSGVTFQRLRYLDVLLIEPWTVQLSDKSGYPVERRGIDVRIPNVPAYLLQKMLALPKRRVKKQPKDILYIHDTLLLFAEKLDDLQATASRVTSALPRPWLTRFRERREVLFDNVTDLVRGAAAIARATGRPEPSSPERIRAVCATGLDRVFKSS